MDELTPEQVSQVKKLVSACNGFIKGKFILTDIKIANILKAIAESEIIYNMLAEYMISFDYEHELKKCCVKTSVDGGSFTLPKDDNLIIPLVFCLLVQIDSKRVDFNYFLRTQFPYAENQNEEYDRFAQSVIVPFRDSIAKKFDVTTKDEEKKPEKPAQNIIDRRILQRQEEVEKQQEEQQEEQQVEEEPKLPPQPFDLFVDELIVSAEGMLQDIEYVRKESKRENIRLVLQALQRACELKELVLINGLIVSLNELVGNEKYLRDYLSDMKASFAKFVNNQDA